MMTKSKDNQFYLASAGIAITFALGLIHYNLNLFDHHGWRQSFTIIVSKNLLSNPNPFYPRTVFCCEGDYIVGSEFPLLNLMLAFLYKIFGYAHWYGRVLNLTITSIGSVYLYKIINKAFHSKIATIAVLLYCSSIIFQFGRKTMPDTFALSLVIAGTWYLIGYVEEKKFRLMVLAGILILCGGLSKFPSLCFLGIFVPFVDVSKLTVNQKNIFIGALVVGFTIIAFWYFFWMPHLVNTYHNQLVWPESFWKGFSLLLSRIDLTIFRLSTAYEIKIPFLFSILGIGIAIFKKNKTLIYIFFSSSFMYLIFMCKAGKVFHDHDYYTIPIIPLLSLLAAFSIDAIFQKKEVMFSIVLVLFALGLLYNHKANRPLQEVMAYEKLELLVNKYCKKEEKVWINLGLFNPLGLYFCNRFGWSENTDSFDLHKSNGYKEKGLGLIVFDKKNGIVTNEVWQKVYEDDRFLFYKP
jgi:4-amino-4-deoxy-L-arabinose transferase-like glycosyltransferase